MGRSDGYEKLELDDEDSGKELSGIRTDPKSSISFVSGRSVGPNFWLGVAFTVATTANIVSYGYIIKV